MPGRLSWRRRVQLWWARTFTVGVPRPQPILLRDLYPEPLRRLHAQLQDWEDERFIRLLDEAPTEAIPELHDEAARLLRAARVYMLQLQRWRHLGEHEGRAWRPDGLEAVRALEGLLEPLFAPEAGLTTLASIRGALEARVEDLGLLLPAAR